MSKVQFIPEHKEVLDSFLRDNEFVKPGKMLGHPAYYVGGKLFASLYMESVCIKLPRPRVEELQKNEGYSPFQPMGRTMKEWIMITHKNSSDYLEDKAVFQEAIEYVTSLTKK